MRNCQDCGKEITGKWKRFCEDCKEKHYLESLKQMREIRKNNGHNYFVDKKCKICNKDLFKVHFSTKYCFVCARLVTLEVAKNKARRRQVEWEKLTEEEKAKRIKIISDKYLNNEL